MIAARVARERRSPEYEFGKIDVHLKGNEITPFARTNGSIKNRTSEIGDHSTMGSFRLARCYMPMLTNFMSSAMDSNEHLKGTWSFRNISSVTRYTAPRDFKLAGGREF